MGDASYYQSSFLGGEWSPEAQGRADNPKYKTAMNVCLNGFPKPEGAWTRRPGSAFRATTRHGNAGRVIPFDFTDAASYEIELTDGFARLFAGSGLVFTNDMTAVTGVSTANPAVVTVASPPAVPWSTGDSVQFLISTTDKAADGALVQNRQFLITVLTPTTFSLADPITGASIDGATLAWDATKITAKLAHVLELPAPYTNSQWESVRKVQAHLVGQFNESVALLLHGSYKPYSLTTPNTLPQATVGQLTGVDVIAGGANYVSPTVTTIDATGSGATFSVTVVGGVITAVTPLTLGANYSPNVALQVADASTGGTGANIQLVFEDDGTGSGNLRVASATVLAGGSGYPPGTTATVVPTGGYITNATLSLTGVAGVITGCSVVNPGSGFWWNFTPPYVVVSGSTTGSGASLAAVWTATSTTAPPAANALPFTLAEQDFLDGPYLDPVVGTTLTQGGTSGSITLTAVAETWSSTQGYPVGSVVVYSSLVYVSLVDPNLNNQPNTHPAAWELANGGIAYSPVGFVSTDVGRMIRLFSEPLLWTSGVDYAASTVVQYNGTYYQRNPSGGSDHVNPPNTIPSIWLVTAGATVAVWTWGRITSVVSPTVVQFTIIGAPLLYDSSTSVVRTWRLGVYSNTTGWPKCGTYYKGRTWLSGVVNNRADSSNSNDPFNMAPTAPDGTVGDSNALNLIFDSDNTNEIFWFEANSQGLVVGTRTGEWTIRPGVNGNGITPTNVQVDRVTKVGCANVLPVSAPLAIIMVNKYQRQMFELFPDVFSGKITAPEMTTFAKHLTTQLVQEIFYQSDPMPIVWGRLGDGSFIGATYTRRSQFASEDPTIVGFHRHTLGSGRTVESISVTPSPDLTLDALSMATVDPVSGIYHVEQLAPILDVGSPGWSAWPVDNGIVPSGAVQTTVAGVAGITFYGLWHLNGETVSAWIGGLDCGDATVNNGSMFVPFGEVFTLAYLQSIAGTGYGTMAVTLDSPAIQFPAVVGFTYTSQGQILRPLAAADVGTQNGPAFAKTRRNHQLGVLITAAINGAIRFGGSLTKTMRPLNAKSPGGTPVPLTELYSGLYWGTVEDDYGFDGMLCWEITRPVPATIASIGGFVHGQDR